MHQWETNIQFSSISLEKKACLEDTWAIFSQAKKSLECSDNLHHFELVCDICLLGTFTQEKQTNLAYFETTHMAV